MDAPQKAGGLMANDCATCAREETRRASARRAGRRPARCQELPRRRGASGEAGWTMDGPGWAVDGPRHAGEKWMTSGPRAPRDKATRARAREAGRETARWQTVPREAMKGGDQLATRVEGGQARAGERKNGWHLRRARQERRAAGECHASQAGVCSMPDHARRCRGRRGPGGGPGRERADPRDGGDGG